MPNTATADVERLLELAERMGLPAAEAIHQVRELRPDADVSERDRPRPVVVDRRRAG